MGFPAARIGDMHVCPLVTPGTPPIPHVGGPIMGPGCPTVLIGGMPAAVMGDTCTCIGPPSSIVVGSMGVFIGGKPAARVTDMTAHGGNILMGCPTVLIGDTTPGSLLPLQLSAMTMLHRELAQLTVMFDAARNGTPFCEVCEAARNANN